MQCSTLQKAPASWEGQACTQEPCKLELRSAAAAAEGVLSGCRRCQGVGVSGRAEGGRAGGGGLFVSEDSRPTGATVEQPQQAPGTLW